MFPVIRTLDDLLPHIAGNSQIRIKTEANGMTVVCYMVQDEDTFMGAAEEYARECRGITFFQDRRIAARCLTKFFNIGEREDTQPQNLPWSKVTRIMEKRDGSMVTPVWSNGQLLFKTKKSFDTKEAALAREICMNTPNGMLFCMKLAELGLTPTFEVTSPKFPIVLKYEKDELTLLHVRENVSGRYLMEVELQDLEPPFPIVANLKEQFIGKGLPANLVSWEKLKAAAETTEKLEGWVIQFEDDSMVKLKTAWYTNLHHAVTFTRWRDIARTVLEDKSDDLKGAFALTGRSIQPILEVEFKIKQRIKFAREAAQQIVESMAAGGVTDAKGMALTLKKHEHFGVIMRTFRKQEIDWLDWYKKNHLESDWGLEVVGDEE